MNLKEFVFDTTYTAGDGAIGVAVSGGRDSMVLLDMLQQRVERTRIVVLHLNHALRQSESDGDEAFVRAYCQKHALKIVSKRLDIDEIRSARGESLEMAARTKRYDFFKEAVRIHGITVLYMGHHGDDQAETILMRIIAGTGLLGLASMRRQREILPGVPIYRPLLYSSRTDIDRYAIERGLGHREDSSNTDEHIMRNKIRRSLMPQLQDINGKVTSHLCELGNDSAALAHWVEPMLDEYCRKAIHGERLCIKEYHRIPVWPRREVLRRWVLSLGVLRPTRERIEALDDFIIHTKQAHRIELGEGIAVERFHDDIRKALEERECEGSVHIEVETKEGYDFAYGGYRWTVRFLNNYDSAYTAKPHEFFISLEDARQGLIVRTRRAGDYVALHKGGRKKIQRFFMDVKIDRDKRSHFPVLAQGNKVVLVPGYFRDATMRPSEGSQSVCIEWRKNE